MTRSTSFVLAIAVLIGCRASKRDFVDGIEPKVVALLCDHDRPANQLPSYYRKCFDIDETQCTAIMRREVHACADKLVRGTVDESNAGALGEQIGACAGTNYELELDRQGKTIRSDACDVARAAYAKARASVGPP